MRLLWLCAVVLGFATLVYTSHDEEPSEHFDVTLYGEYYWQLLYYVDNTQNDNHFKEVLELTKKVHTSYSEIMKTAFSAATKLHLGEETGVKMDLVSASVQNSLDVDLSASYERTVEKKEDITMTEVIKVEFTVGANSTGAMYRLNYRGPGVSYQTNTFSSNISIPFAKVEINCRVKPVRMIKNYQVFYTDDSVDRPENIITETLGTSPDINRNCRGKHVWLTPVWTTNVKEATTNIQFVLQNKNKPGYANLAEGDGRSERRYLKLLHEKYSPTRVGRIGLLRESAENRTKYGWDNCTENINQGRHGGSLHLCWNNVFV